MIAIIDYGMGNIHSVSKAVDSLGAQIVVTNDPKEIKKADKLILPGVGAFGDAMLEIKKRNLDKAIIEHVKEKKYFLGICLGMHLIFATSEESVGVDGLNLLEGDIKKFIGSNSLKVPHMGWNQINFRKADCPLFKGLEDKSSVYFCHSFYVQAKDNSVIAASTEYGQNFASIAWKDNVFATQFHPEKSQTVGLKILENFVKL